MNFCFNRESWREETVWKTWAYVGR